MNFRVVIPARLESSRLPNKVLREIAGKPMIRRVYENALKSQAKQVIIATDSERVAACASEFSATVCMTSAHHQSGTERIAEAVALLGFDDDDIIVNVQGDEPCVPPALMIQLASTLVEHANINMATLYEPITDIDAIFNPHVVKVVLNADSNVVYFSRAPIPWDRTEFDDEKETCELSSHYHRHIGLYAYRVGFLKHYAAWPVSPIEKIECLEQLRVLWHGEKIHAAQVIESSGPDVNTEEDFIRIQQFFSSL